jgi:hypothetical protein
MPAYRPVTVVASARIRPDEFDRLRCLADSRDATVSRLVARFTREGLARHGA